MEIFNENKIIEINEFLNSGNILAVPTETVYGLAVKYDDMNAISKLKKLKDRGNKSFTMMIYDKNDISKYGILSKQAKRIAEKFFPGELTLVLPKNSEFKNELFNDIETIGIRIPNHEFLLSLLKNVGPLIVTSANLKDEKPCLDSDEVLEHLHMIDGVVSGVSGKKIPSTVIYVEGDNIKMLREGPISLDDINS